MTIGHFMSATSLSNTNSTKILELEDELSSSLRDAVAGRDEIEVASFIEDEILLLGAVCARLTMLEGTREMTSWMEEDEGGKQSNAWDIMMAIAERGRLGYKEEEQVSFSLSLKNADRRSPRSLPDDRTRFECAEPARYLEGTRADFGCRSFSRRDTASGIAQGTTRVFSGETGRVRCWHPVQHSRGCQADSEWAHYFAYRSSNLIIYRLFKCL
jgi:hypothetical protein